MFQNHDLSTEIAKAVPPILVTGAITVGGYDLDTWVKLLTIVYIVLQICFLLFKAGRLRGRQDRDE